MTDNLVNKNLFSKRHRPFGIWILTIHAVIFSGFSLYFGSSGMVLRGEVAMFRSDDIPIMLLRAYLFIGIIIASILAWSGWEPGRLIFLLLISVFYLWTGMDRFSWITSPHFWKILPWEIDDRISWVLKFIGEILILILYIWYFNKPSTRAFYKKVEKVTE